MTFFGFYYRKCNVNLVLTPLLIRLHSCICSLLSSFSLQFLAHTESEQTKQRDRINELRGGIDYQRKEMKNHGIIYIFSTNANGTHNVNTTFNKKRRRRENERVKHTWRKRGKRARVMERELKPLRSRIHIKSFLSCISRQNTRAVKMKRNKKKENE